MSTTAEILLWNTSIGAIHLPSNESVAQFEYAPSFVSSGIQVAPMTMPLSRKIYRFPELSYATFHGLPGLVTESLPDKFGNALIDVWLAQQGRTPDSFNAVERLCYTGIRGMGALEYRPIAGPVANTSSPIDVAQLVELASQVLSKRKILDVNISSTPEYAMNQILKVGTSAGGARAKAVVAWNRATNEIRSGQLPADAGFEYWLLKFDGVVANSDKEVADPRGYGLIEYAYYLMAGEAGIEMSDCHLFSENGRNHFMTKRFDRTSDGAKLHTQTLGAFAHYDFNVAGAYSYEQVFDIIRRAGMPAGDVEQFFRRMAFNIIFRNQDDHVKNISFIMDRRGNWQLAPAYDITYSYNPDGLWTGVHQMSMNGKRNNFTLDDFRACGNFARLVRGRAVAIAKELSALTGRWLEVATSAGVPLNTAEAILRTFRTF